MVEVHEWPSDGYGLGLIFAWGGKGGQPNIIVEGFEPRVFFAAKSMMVC